MNDFKFRIMVRIRLSFIIYQYNVIDFIDFALRFDFSLIGALVPKGKDPNTTRGRASFDS